MRIEHVTRTHRIEGRMVLAKRPSHDRARGGAGFTVSLEGGVSKFYAKGTQVDVTGYTERLPASSGLRASRSAPRLDHADRQALPGRR